MKLTYKITIPIFVVLLSAVTIVAVFSRREFKNAVFQENFAATRDSVFKKFHQQFLNADDFKNFETPEAQKVFGDFAHEIITPSTARFTLWNLDEVVVFSDLSSLIGQKSEYNPELKKAIAEKSSFFVLKSKDNNKPVQSDVGEFSDIYVPVELAGELVGVAEIHAVSAAVLQPLGQALNNIIYILILSGVVELAAIFAVVRFVIIKPLKKLESEILKIKRGGGRRGQIN